MKSKPTSNNSKSQNSDSTRKTKKDKIGFTLIIFKSNARGMQYGMGSYLRELVNALINYSYVKIILIHYNSSTFREFSFEIKTESYSEVHIPASINAHLPSLSYDEKYSSAVLNLLSSTVPFTGTVVFVINHISEYYIIKRIRERYKYPIVSVVHSAQWQLLFDGNKKRFENIATDALVKNLEVNFLHEKEIFQISDVIISVTNYMKTYITDEYQIYPSKIKVIHNGINSPNLNKLTTEDRISLKQSLGFRSDESIILFSGRLDPSKGVYFLIESFIKACKIIDNIRLIIVGQGNVAECFNKCVEFHGKITYTGYLKQEDVYKFYQVADIGILPSLYEQCPYTVLEMMAFGIPLILSGIDGLKEILSSNECIFLKPIVNEGGNIEFDTDEMAHAIVELLGNNILRESFSNRYIELANTVFSAKRMGRDVMEVLDSLKH